MAQQSPSPAPYFYYIGLALLVASAVVGFTANKDSQLIGAGALIGGGIAAGLSFIAAAVIYMADRGRQG